VENKKKRKEIKKMRGDYECEGERKKYYLYQELGLLALCYIVWVGLSGF
jgi:hypothetical protein